MDTSILNIAGQVAGIGGLALGVLLLIFRDVIRKEIFPTLTRDQSYKLIRLIIVLAFVIAALGITAWVYTSKLADRGNTPEQTKRSSYYVRVTDAASRLSIPRAKVFLVVGENLMTGETDQDGLYKTEFNFTSSTLNIRVDATGYMPFQSVLPLQKFQDVPLLSMKTVESVSSTQLRPNNPVAPIQQVPTQVAVQTPTNNNNGNSQSNTSSNTATQKSSQTVILIDGDLSLQNQQLTLQTEESLRFGKLFIMSKGTTAVKANQATFAEATPSDVDVGKLLLVEVPDEQSLPSIIMRESTTGKRFVFSSTIYANGREVQVAGFR